MNQSYNLTEIAAALLTGIMGGYFSHKLLIHKERNTYTKEKYENVIFPIFEIIESYLYSKEITSEINSAVQQICHIVINNRKYINGLLLENIDVCLNQLKDDNSITNNSFTNLCSIISVEYDKSCKKLGISKRTFAYKFNNNQLHPDKITILNYIVYATLYICIFMCAISLGYMLFQFITTILKSLGI